MALEEGHGRLPSWFGDQQQRVEMRDEANLMPLNLILTAAFVFGAGGRETLVGFHLRVLILRTRLPLMQFPLVSLEVAIDTLQFAV